nr:hypothetical protein [Paraburkholderia fynbosensis]
MLLSVALSACAPAIQVQGTQLTSLIGTQQRVRIVQPVFIKLATGYSRQVRGGSQWRPVGELPQGVVFQPVGGVFTIEGRQVHEAYLVVKGQTLTGFFLPRESHFSPLEPPQSITFERIND